MPIKSEEQVCATKVVFGMSLLTPLARSAPPRLFIFCFMLMSGSLGWTQEAAPADETAGGEPEDVTTLTPMQVKGARVEDFGFRITERLLPPPFTAMISEVFPNTAAAKAGLRPGEVISKFDEKPNSLMFFSLKLKKLQQQKRAAVEAGKKDVTYSLEVHPPGKPHNTRTVTLVLPSPAPHWGSKTWSAPEGRMPAVIQEAGPLAALTREVLDNGIWSVLKDESLLGTAPCFEDPILGYEWRLGREPNLHRIWVTRQRGKTEIVLSRGNNHFLTSPSGALEKTGWRPIKRREKQKEISPEELRAEFATEIDFWLNKVGRVTGRWPFEALSGKTEVTGSSSGESSESSKMNAPLAKSFLKLPVATAEQKELFFAALDKVGLDADCWAFTETSRSLEDDRVTNVRYDPSKPPEESNTLLKVDGKAPTAASLEQWRKEGRTVLPGLGELPALSSVVDVNDVRIYADETAAVVFELPVKASNTEFPVDKFQARFRVNKTHHGFEDFSVKLREPMRVAGIAKVTDAGLEARFQTFDSSLAPQPVLLKMGGGVRVLFVKISRSFEVTRTDFKRVVPFEEPVKPAL